MSDRLPNSVRMPAAGLSRNPLEGIRPDKMWPVPVGVAIAETIPPEIQKRGARGLLICVVNGSILSRITDEQHDYLQAMREGGHAVDKPFVEMCTEARNWQTTLTMPGDIVEWHDRPMGREGIRVLLAVAIVVASFVPGGQVFLPYLVAANIAYNLLVPPKQPLLPGKADDVFSASLSGNQARLDQPIWRNCGRVKITPPFAAQPYLEFREHDPANPLLNCDQYYYAVFAIGVGNHEIERTFISKTPISHYQGVLVAQYLPPGVLPSTALLTVVTSNEVSNADLETGEYVGGFVASLPTRLCSHIGIDIGAPQGLGSGTNPVQVTWEVDAREINDFGAPINDWFNLGAEERAMNTATAQRWSVKYKLPYSMRVEVRVVRTNDKNDAASARDGIQWIGLRGYMDVAAPLNANTAHFEVVMKATAQLNNQTQADFSMIVRAMVRTWNPTDGWGASSGSGGEIFTRNAAWWLADLWTNPIWGEGLPDDQVDLQGLYEWSLILDQRQDHFDYSFSTALDAWEAAQVIANSGRGRAFRRHGVYTVVRDQIIDLPITAFTPRNCLPGTVSLTTALPQLDAPDGVVMEYISLVTWDSTPIECPCPGYSVSDPTNPRFDPSLPAIEHPVYLSCDGVTGSKHAEREGLYQAASLALRTTTAQMTVEMEAVTIAFMDPVRLQPQIPGYGQAGDVAFWDADTLVMGLTEPPNFAGDEPIFLTLVRDDGTLTEPVQVAPGPTHNDIILPAVPDFDMILDSGFRERPKYVLGPETTGDEMVKITAISDGGKSDGGVAQLYKIDALVDDDRVHLADIHLLPGPGEIQDPIDDFGEDGDTGGGPAHLVRLQDHVIVEFSVDGVSPGGIEGFTLKNDGTVEEFFAHDYALIGTPTIRVTPSEWLTHGPVDPSVSAGYECYIAADPGFFPGWGFVITGTFNTWLPLDVNRTWSFAGNPPALTPDRLYDGLTFGTTVSIRRVGSTVISAQRNIYFGLRAGGGGAGDGDGDGGGEGSGD